MSNNAAGLNAFLDAQLGDTTDTIWPSADKDNVIAWAVAGLWPRISRPFDPEAAASANKVTLVSGTYFYSLPTGMLAVSRIDWLDTSGNEMGSLGNGSWEVTGGPLASTGKLHVSPAIADTGGTLRLHGYGRYDVTTNLIPDDYVPLVLATARAELYRRTAGDRVRYQEWMSRQQVQNVSVNELLQFLSDADRDAARERAKYRTWQRPVPGRVP